MNNSIPPLLPKIIIAALALLLSWVPTAHADDATCSRSAAPDGDYPELTSSVMAGLGGSFELILYVDEQHVIVEVGGCFYRIGDQILEIGVGVFDEFIVSFVFADLLSTARLLIHTEGGAWLVLEPRGGYFEYRVSEGVELFLSLDGGNPNAPIVPIVIRKPTEPEQEPS